MLLSIIINIVILDMRNYHGGNIFYGLGNFFFDEPKDADKLWTEGFLLQLELVEHSLANCILIPYVQCTKEIGCSQIDE